ncbi:MAG: pyruvate, phosphate dikinase [Deltaproteobacteria bacterium]|nr:pyruvate, phosphate dikinase [Deltaproteobacteria bacterium]
MAKQAVKEAKKKRYCFAFEEGDGTNKKLLGGKGAGLCSMTQIGLPVPPGFVITTEANIEYLDEDRFPEGLMDEVHEYMEALEKKTGKGFGDPAKPLLVSVRSGSALSMPGMMDTILNLGLNDDTVKGMIALTQNERFVQDAYRRFLQLFGKIGLGVEPDPITKEDKFDKIFEEVKEKYHAHVDTELSAEAMAEVVQKFKDLIKRVTGRPFPQDPWAQLFLATEGVFKSWMGKRAVDYRRQFNITPDMAYGTAVNICTMVFGNMGTDSATGVGFTRDPGTGENILYGDYLINAQGEDVVAGIRTPRPLKELRTDMPAIYKELVQMHDILEKHYREVQDFEFTIEQGKLYMLQTRNGKMNAWALVKTSVDMEKEGLINQEEALLRIEPDMLEQFLHRRIDPDAKMEPLAVGISASPGAAIGKVVFDADRAERLANEGEKVILTRVETKPEDIHGFFAAQGILTSRGGKTSHAAVVARGMGKPCVSGVEGLDINYDLKEARVGDVVIKEGDIVTIDGTAGSMYLGTVPMLDPELPKDLAVLMDWADKFAHLEVWANADTPDMAAKARHHGAKGIGLCRTERMFNEADRLPFMRNMILADSPEERKKWADKLMPMQRADFVEIFRAMEGLPVTIRLLDPPLHEFLPSIEELINETSRLKEFSMIITALEQLPGTVTLLGPDLYQHVPSIEAVTRELSEFKVKGLDQKLLKERERVLRRVRVLTEYNPMLGNRGVRCGISFPEIYDMQIQAIFEATAIALREKIDARPEIMIPNVCTRQELVWVKPRVEKIHKEVEKRYHVKIKYKFGTMVEIARACVRAARLAETAEFFSFGTNDLTQGTFSFSREDAENKFLPIYNTVGILRHNPFEILDELGVGWLMQHAVAEGRKVRPDLKIGICGEHGGQPQAIEFCHRIGLNYVSCSPMRIPIARMAAAHAMIKEKKGVAIRSKAL